MACKVSNCRFSASHTTLGHHCGNCSEYGHGQVECGNQHYIDRLATFKDKLPINMHCTMIHCNHKEYHTSRAHHCKNCGRNHDVEQCIITDYTGQIQFENLNETFTNQDNIYTIRYAGMGCEYYIRKKNGHIQILFMHNDNWGQYGEATNDKPILDEFIDELDMVPNPAHNNDGGDGADGSDGAGADAISVIETSVECPLCRTKNEKNEIFPIKGSSESCSICYDNNVERYFSKCEHACVCKECYDRL